MDCAGLWPKWGEWMKQLPELTRRVLTINLSVNIRRGQYICAVLGVVICPWQLLASATTFLTFLNGFGVILAPMMGVLSADYLIVRRTTLEVEDLYSSSRDGIYWYTAGFNWRGIVSIVMGIWPCFPGLIMLVC